MPGLPRGSPHGPGGGRRRGSPARLPEPPRAAGYPGPVRPLPLRRRRHAQVRPFAAGRPGDRVLGPRSTASGCSRTTTPTWRYCTSLPPRPPHPAALRPRVHGLPRPRGRDLRPVPRRTRPSWTATASRRTSSTAVRRQRPRPAAAGQGRRLRPHLQRLPRQPRRAPRPGVVGGGTCAERATRSWRTTSTPAATSQIFDAGRPAGLRDLPRQPRHRAAVGGLPGRPGPGRMLPLPRAGRLGHRAIPGHGAVLDSLQTEEALSKAALDEAENAGMEVSQALFDLQDVTDALTKARGAIHSFRADTVRAEAGAGFELTSEGAHAGEGGHGGAPLPARGPGRVGGLHPDPHHRPPAPDPRARGPGRTTEET